VLQSTLDLLIELAEVWAGVLRERSQPPSLNSAEQATTLDARKVEATLVSWLCVEQSSVRWTVLRALRALRALERELAPHLARVPLVIEDDEDDDDCARDVSQSVTRAANAVALHTARDPSFTMQERAPAKVLEEEEYLDNLERIIRRDFFPAVDAMQQRLAVPTPAWSGRVTASAARQRHADETPGATPQTAAALRHRAHRREGEQRIELDGLTPALQRADSPSRLEPGAAAAASASSAGASSAASAALIPHSSSNSAAAAAAASAAQTKLHPHELRLGSYLSLHTSEDNASFDAIQAKRRKQIDERRPWTSDEAEQKINDTRIVLVDDKERGGNMSGWKYKMRNRLFFYPDHEGRSERSADAYQSSKTRNRWRTRSPKRAPASNTRTHASRARSLIRSPSTTARAKNEQAKALRPARQHQRRAALLLSAATSCYARRTSFLARPRARS